MADYLCAALDTYATSSHRVVLFLDSTAGQVEEGDRVIHVLDEIKQTHHLITTVLNDKVCASMSIFLSEAMTDLPRARASGSSIRPPSRAPRRKHCGRVADVCGDDWKMR
jgi:hypothetical protein